MTTRRPPQRRPGRPQGRLPREVYVRRRLLVVAAAIALVWGGLQVGSSLGGGDDERRTVAATPGSAPTSAASSAASPTPSAAASTAPTSTRRALDVSVASGSAACDPEAVRVMPSVAKGQHAGGAVKVQLTVSSTARTGCTLDLAKARLLVVITANGNPVYDSSVCETPFATGKIALAPGWGTVVDAAWNGRGSGSHCSGAEGWASPGSYTMQIATLGGEPAKAQLSLAQKPAPKKKSTKKSTKGGGASSEKASEKKASDRA